jgi:selenophosphate synthase
VEYLRKCTEAELNLLHDPQTSGGLLIALGVKKKEEFIREAISRGLTAIEIGEVLLKSKIALQIL